MKIVGLNGSGRRNGNTELLLRKALKGAEKMGAAVEQVNLAELNIRPCRGCMACVFKESGCPVDDDMPLLLEKLAAADGLILAAPTYILSPAGVVKMVLDRSLPMFKKAPGLKNNRFAVTINVAGLKEWNDMGQEQLTLFALVYQFKIIGTLQAYGPGPGEVLLEPGIPEKAENLGISLASAGDITPPSSGNCCPVCRSRLFRFEEDGSVICPICSLKGKVANLTPLQLVFDPQSAGNHRWTKENITKHYQEWILASRDRYKKQRKAIMEAQAKYFPKKG